MTLARTRHQAPVTTLMVLVSLVVLGLVALTRLPLAFMPDIVEPELFVQLPYDNASPEQVERMIVRPVEDAVGSVRGLQSMWSRCGSDGGRIRLEFDWATDMHLARVEVWERIDRIRGDLPDDIGDIQVSTNWDSPRRGSAHPGGPPQLAARPERELRPARAQDHPAPGAGAGRGPGAPGRREPARGAHQPARGRPGAARHRRARRGAALRARQLRPVPGQDHHRRLPLHPAHRRHLRTRRGDPRTCPCAPTACACATWPTSSTRSRPWSTAATWTAISPSA